MTNDLNLSLLEICAVLGLAQTISVLVYIVSRAGHVRHIIVPFLTFFVLAASFLMDFALRRYEGSVSMFVLWQSAVWMMVPTVSALLIRQIINLGEFPAKYHWGVLALPLVFFLIVVVLGRVINDTHALMLLGTIICSAFSLVSLWIGHRNFSLLGEDGTPKGERYWLIISTILINVGLMMLYMVYLMGGTSQELFYLARDVLGVGLVYLASTSLFRIYPPAIKLVKVAAVGEVLSNEDSRLIELIDKLLEMDKVYQEPQFSRASLARELNISEARASRLVNIHFGKSLPQLVNEYRVRDSLQLLEQTTAPVQVIAEEVGFNSVPTFNRVFKDVVGQSPTDYRLRKNSA